MNESDVCALTQVGCSVLALCADARRMCDNSRIAVDNVSSSLTHCEFLIDSPAADKYALSRRPKASFAGRSHEE
jgi:hypothetical protein